VQWRNFERQTAGKRQESSRRAIRRMLRTRDSLVHGCDVDHLAAAADGLPSPDEFAAAEEWPVEVGFDDRINILGLRYGDGGLTTSNAGIVDEDFWRSQFAIHDFEHASDIGVIAHVQLLYGRALTGG
jgi:hypothetical protein